METLHSSSPDIIRLHVWRNLIRYRPTLISPVRNYAAVGSAGFITSQEIQLCVPKLQRSLFNVDGSGIKVGVLSDSYNTISGNPAGLDVSHKDLPGPGNPKRTPIRLKLFMIIPMERSGWRTSDVTNRTRHCTKSKTCIPYRFRQRRWFCGRYCSAGKIPAMWSWMMWPILSHSSGDGIVSKL